ncbi:MAG: 3-isopropylmalate dehydratase small subunit [Hyphomonadaceae bacterium]|nr:3-isopropylmalate dehydratase small subunit [Hyphomonadaceae bacterium]
MQPFTSLTAIAAPLPIANLDTDQIIPKQFLVIVDRQGLAKGLLYDLRFDADGKENPDFVLNQAAYKGAQILIGGPNFGCGSSREHAPWAFQDFGIKCILAPSFADIFYENCVNNGLLPAKLSQESIDMLMEEAKGGNHRFIVDLEAQTVSAPSGKTFKFDIDPGRKTKLLKGLDAIGMTLERAPDIAAFEEKRRLAAPWRP